ncbi:hypothetical protein ACS0TY_033326 [Phlomoides rotata]
MGCSDVPTPVFIETNLGTRLAAPLSPDITAMEFKRELEGMHLNCFPEFGSIKVNALMVKQRSHCYHLSESLPLEYAFLGLNDTRFLQMDVDLRSTPVHVESLKHSDAQLHNISSIANVVTDSVELGGFTMSRSKRKRKKVKASVLKQKHENGHPAHGPEEVNWTEKRDNNVIAEARSITFSEPASVSGIIKKYFSDYDEVASSVRSRRSREWLSSSIECKNSSPQKASREKHIKPGVGNRVLMASESLGLSHSNQRPILGKSLFQKSTATVGNLVFEL